MLGKILILLGIVVLAVGFTYKTTSREHTQTGSIPLKTGGSLPEWGEVEMPDAKRQNTRNIIVFCGIVLAAGGVATRVFKPPA